MTDKIAAITAMMHGRSAGRVPVILESDVQYACEFAGLDFLKATWNHDDIVAALDAYWAAFEVDADFGPAWLSPEKSAILGSRNWVQNTANGVMQHPEVTALMAEDYDAFIDDPVGCLLERALPRLHARLEGPPAQQAATLAKAQIWEQTALGDFWGKVFAVAEKHKVPLGFGTIVYAPFDLLGDHLRGITQIMKDLRKCPEKVEQACAVLARLMLEQVHGALPSCGDFPMVACFVHLPPLLSPAQFERFFWPSFKQVCDTLVHDGYSMFIQFQGDYRDGKYFPFINQLPADQVVIAIEIQDFGQALEALGEQHMVCCSYPMSHFGRFSQEECVEKARELMETGAVSNKRFFFCLDKPVTSVKEAAPEKLKAVLDFVRGYRLGKGG